MKVMSERVGDVVVVVSTMIRSVFQGFMFYVYVFVFFHGSFYSLFIFYRIPPPNSE